MNIVLLLAVFASPVAAGAVIGWWQWFWPRHRLMVIFREAKRVRLARAAAAEPVAPVVSLLTVVGVVT